MKNTQIQNGRHLLQNIGLSGSGGYKNLTFVANCVILRRLNKLNPVFILEKKISYFLVKRFFLTVFLKYFFLQNPLLQFSH